MKIETTPLPPLHPKNGTFSVPNDMPNKEPTKEWVIEFDEKYDRQFKEFNPVVEVSGHHETEFLHETYPAVTRFHPNGDITQHPAKFDVSRTVEDGAIDKREVYVTEYQVNFRESLKSFISQAIQEAIKAREAELIEKVKVMDKQDGLYSRTWKAGYETAKVEVIALIKG